MLLCSHKMRLKLSGLKMLKLSKKTEYAIIAIIEISDMADDELATARGISEKHGIPPELLGKVLQSLARNEVIESQQGIKGGYKLKMPLKQINIYRVISAAEGPINLVECISDDSCDCNLWGNCTIQGPMEFIQIEFRNFFNSITLQDFKDRYVVQTPLVQIQNAF